MAKNKINQMLQQKDPAVLRTPIKPVSILNAAAETEQERRSNRKKAFCKPPDTRSA
jgi:hypothetical protein